MNSPADILYELEQAQERFGNIAEHYEDAHEARNALVKQALAAGVKQADIARLTGLSRARIAQLR